MSDEMNTPRFHPLLSLTEMNQILTCLELQKQKEEKDKQYWKSDPAMNEETRQYLIASIDNKILILEGIKQKLYRTLRGE